MVFFVVFLLFKYDEFRYFFVLTTLVFFNHGLGCIVKEKQNINK